MAAEIILVGVFIVYAILWRKTYNDLVDHLNSVIDRLQEENKEWRDAFVKIKRSEKEGN